MACPIPLRLSLRRISPSRLRNFQQNAPSRRDFLSFPGSEVITLHESRILPYNSTSIYALISDIDCYANFIPYCQESKVTRWSELDTKGKRWPEQADLKIGWGSIEETFTSRVNCIPGSIVEALGGDAVSTVAKHPSRSMAPVTTNNVFKRLSTKWTVKPIERKVYSGNPSAIRNDLTEVHLAIEFQFTNPLYGALSKAVAPKLAEIMIEAFEKRAKLLLESPEASGVHRPAKKELAR